LRFVRLDELPLARRLAADCSPQPQTEVWALTRHIVVYTAEMFKDPFLTAPDVTDK
jgi:hypothetical protein